MEQRGVKKKSREGTNECKLEQCVFVNGGQRQRNVGKPTEDGLLLWVCVDLSVCHFRGSCCSGKEGTCIFAIKLLPMHSHRGRNHHNVSSFEKISESVSTVVPRLLCWDVGVRFRTPPSNK